MAELVSIKRNVDVSPGQAAPAVFHCSQGDVGSKIILGLLDNGTAYSIPSGVTVTIEGSESNGSIFTPISATASGSDITFYLTGEMTAVAGPAICQAVLKSGSNILGTANFTLEVESSPMGADAPPVFTDAGWTWMLNKLTTEFVPALGDNIIDAIDSKADQSDLTALSNTVAGHTGSITVLNNTVNNLNHDVTENRQNIARKLDKNQGTANAGKYLKVGADGNVETADLDVTTDKTLSVADKAADAKAVGDEITNLSTDLSTEEKRAQFEEARIEALFTAPTQEAVDNWLDNHPEATTTVQDEAVTRNKLAQHITDYLPLDYIQTKFEKDGGETTVWYAIIPSDYKPKLRLANDTIHTVETAVDNAYRNHSTITINCGIFYMADGNTKGYLIDGDKVLNDINYNNASGLEYLYMSSDGVLNSVNLAESTSVNDLKSLNPKWAVLGWYPIVKNGEYVATGRADDYYNAPRTFIGQDVNGNYIVGVSSGRNEDEKGLSMLDIYNFCLNIANFTPYFLYNLDGGGSSAFIYKGTRVSALTQGENRKCANYLSFEKENTRLTNTFEAINVIDNELIGIEQYLYNNVELMTKIPKRIKSISTSGFTDCNNIIETSIYLCSVSTANFPIADYGFLITLRMDEKLANQIALNKNHLYIRQLWIDTTITPSEWKEVFSSPIYAYATSGTNVSENAVMYIRSGNVIVVRCDAYISATISANSILATDLPKGFVQEQNGIIFKSGNMYRVKITNDGKLINYDELPSGYYRLSLTYICR